MKSSLSLSFRLDQMTLGSGLWMGHKLDMQSDSGEEKPQCRDTHNTSGRGAWLYRKSLVGNLVTFPDGSLHVLLATFHEAHLETVDMSTSALSGIWWPWINHLMENHCRQCQACQEPWHKPPKAPASLWHGTSKTLPMLRFYFEGSL